MMKSIGIRKIYYTVKDNIICEHVNQMVSINSSFILRELERNHFNAPVTDNEYFRRLILRNIPRDLKLKNIECFLKYNFILTIPSWSYEISNRKFTIFDENKIVFVIINII